MKKLLVLAAVSAMGVTSAMAAYTLSLQGAKAVYVLTSESELDDISSGWAAEQWENQSAVFFNEQLVKQVFHVETWADAYSTMDPMFLKFTGADGNFSLDNFRSWPGMGNGAEAWVLLALTDNTTLTPGGAYSVYYGTSVKDFSDNPEGSIEQPPPMGGPITIQEMLASGNLRTDSPTPAPEPTSGLLLLLGVAGLALKRKRA